MHKTKSFYKKGHKYELHLCPRSVFFYLFIPRRYVVRVVITRRHVVGVAPYSVIWTIVANYHYLTSFLSRSGWLNPILRSTGYNPNRTSYEG